MYSEICKPSFLVGYEEGLRYVCECNPDAVKMVLDFQAKTCRLAYPRGAFHVAAYALYDAAFVLRGVERRAGEKYDDE
jgi:hypothetical protein